mmetsp:Transcript_6441/g.10053  ORF Transcript_6441/g.10053 Transcript_6441/m.10053 type:complete len:206 (+) Transcript_6441:189-806(+)
MLDTDFFGLDGPHDARHVGKAQFDLSLPILRGDFLDDFVGRGRERLSIGTNVNDAKDGRGDCLGWQEALDNLVDPQIVLPDLRTRRIKSDNSLLCTHFAKHCQHVLQVIVVQVEDGRIFRILFERNRKGVGAVNLPFGDRSQKDADHTLSSSSSNAMIMIGSTQQDQGVHDHLVDIPQQRCLHYWFIFVYLHRRHLWLVSEMMEG